MIGNYDGDEAQMHTPPHSGMEPEAYTALAVLKKWLSRPSSGVLCTGLAAAAVTGIFASFADERRLPDVAMLYLVVTLVSAATWGYAVGTFSAVLTNVLLNFYFIPPVHEFTVADRGNVGGLVLFLLVALLAAGLVSRLRRNSERFRSAVAENALLLEVSQAVASASADAAAAAFCTSAAHSLKAARVEIIEDRGGWTVRAGSTRTGQRLPESESSAAARVWERAAGERDSTFRGDGVPIFFALPPGGAPAAVFMVAGMLERPPCVDFGRFMSALATTARVAIRLRPSEG